MLIFKKCVLRAEISNDHKSRHECRLGTQECVRHKNKNKYKYKQ